MNNAMVSHGNGVGKATIGANPDATGSGSVAGLLFDTIRMRSIPPSGIRFATAEPESKWIRGISAGRIRLISRKTRFRMKKVSFLKSPQYNKKHSRYIREAFTR